MHNQVIRLNKFLAERLGVSRREADELIAAGKITVNGKPATLGAQIDISWTGDRLGRAPAKLPKGGIAGRKNLAGPVQKPEIRCNGKIVSFETKYTYLAFNKPVGYVCSRRAQGKAPTLYNLLPTKYHNLKTVGRLDKDSSGLILLTNDGDFAFQMTHPKFRKNKIYKVELDKPLTPLHQQMISDFGVLLDDGVSRFIVVKDDSAGPSSSGRSSRPSSRGSSLRPRSNCGCPSEETHQNRYIVTLTEGRNRQIRRTFAALGYKVTKLHRIQFGKYQLGDLKPGKYQEIP